MLQTQVLGPLLEKTHLSSHNLLLECMLSKILKQHLFFFMFLLQNLTFL